MTSKSPRWHVRWRKQNEVRRIRPNTGAPAGLAAEVAGRGFEGTREFPQTYLGGENCAQRSPHSPGAKGGWGRSRPQGRQGLGLVPEGTGHGVTKD